MEASFSTPVQTGPGSHPDSSTVDTGSFQGVKRSGHGADPPPHLQCRCLKLLSAISLPALKALVVCKGKGGTFTFTNVMAYVDRCSKNKTFVLAVLLWNTKFGC